MNPYWLVAPIERAIIALRKQFLMKEFVRMSLEKVERQADIVAKKIPLSSSVGVFGIGDAANVIHARLALHGLHRVEFIATNPPMTRHRFQPVLDLNGFEFLRIDVIITSSLSGSERQEQVLRDKGYSGRIIKIGEFGNCSTILNQDLSTYSRIEALTGIHAGRPAFVIGNGPSLADTDPRRIDDRFITLAGNGIVNLDGFSPNYYFALDRNAIHMWSSKIANLSSMRLFPAHLARMVRRDGKYWRDSIFFPVCYRRFGEYDLKKWKSLGFESGQTVVSPMIQFAMLMGCNPIYLIGVDLSYGVGRNYFSDEYHTRDMPAYKAEDIPIYNHKMSCGIQRIAQACSVSGVQIYNCAPSKNLPFFPELSFDSVLSLS